MTSTELVSVADSGPGGAGPRAVAWSGVPATAGPGDAAGAIARLPGSAGLDPFTRLLGAFLLGYPRHSTRAYYRDVSAWDQWCDGAGVHPFDAQRWHVDLWARQLGEAPSARTGRPLAAASIARRLSAVSAFYDYGISVGVLASSPVANVRRPKVSADSTTVGLTAPETGRLIAAAAAHSCRYHALVALLADNGVRIDEALSADVDYYTYQRGHQVLRVRRKGGRDAIVPLAPPTVRAIEDYLDDGHPLTGPLFLGRGGRRLAYTSAYQQIRRLAAKAGIPAAAVISPHSLRHTWVTESLALGVALQDVQDGAGHADPRTTRRYDRSRHNLDRHPAYVLAAHLRRAPAGQGTDASLGFVK
jgi:integrase/recombinase XerD